ncbi:acetyl-CoA carboxylase biotin carboxylase subunit [Denitrobaculum tricleocarpae]|uniref:Acetyl/propionyl/methylcrotonyl-CoA carboxylase subunit alpha n=1 Tax=Denitrobaculum tricleocarpae TaxID=2591009 RepID=A0A545TL73_9PROT|nr:acetyl/propionyl/methylcrotonyl-CoA carboxylase subunit alpha [Denitrobaculum tricleocarpae]TQV77969.1 acetyl/propionyl/methylcrotonyl-CoA carboxylase subunit alpha [Denitrobaculum tricleocarpae]
MFDKILIANRGEIACRVIETARRMGVATVAVYSDADRDALHVACADEACHIGPAPATESYLLGAKIIEAARRTGAQAVHPGYGFLSENAEFADACADAGLTFIGPPADAIRAMGSKSEAKALMERASVPLVPGYHGADQDPALLASEAEKIGYPVLIKASAGGGGKGMRIVRSATEFPASLDSAKREAASSFGDERVLVEKYLTAPRHIEVQVFADSLGNAVYLFERDCSVQRRHQKVIEEAPAPGMTEARRAEMGEAAVAAAQAIGYQGAGTVEFIAEGEDFYFMEMNTRLQVEHPVTEMITGQDLVEWQLRVASGEALPLSQSELTISGHAFEVRLYAEDPQRDFLPATGRLLHFETPPQTRHLRLDSGVRTGDSVTVFYDPMIAKLIVWDRDRASALARLRAALAGTYIVGVTTNTAFLAAVAAHPAFAEGGVDTGFIERYAEDLLPAPEAVDDDCLALAALAEMSAVRREAAQDALRSGDGGSPWFRTDGWRLNGETRRHLLFQEGEQEFVLDIGYAPGGGLEAVMPGGAVMSLRGDWQENRHLRANLDGRVVSARVLRHAQDFTVLHAGRNHLLHLLDPRNPDLAGEDEGGQLTAPMSGKIVAVRVEPGEAVAQGQVLVVLEAMKMEHSITAAQDAVVSRVFFAAGDLVEEGAELLSLETADD